jgi:hypothetical protein
MPSTVGVVASNNCSPILTMQNVTRFFSNEEGPETIFESFYNVVANGLTTTISVTTNAPNNDVITTNGGSIVAAGIAINKSSSTRHQADLALTPTYYPIITLTNAAGTVTKQQ